MCMCCASPFLCACGANSSEMYHTECCLSHAGYEHCRRCCYLLAQRGSSCTPRTKNMPLINYELLYLMLAYVSVSNHGVHERIHSTCGTAPSHLHRTVYTQKHFLLPFFSGANEIRTVPPLSVSIFPNSIQSFFSSFCSRSSEANIWRYP